MEGEITLQEASQAFGIDRVTLYRWCVSGTLKLARQVPKGTRMTWVVDAAEVKARISPTPTPGVSIQSLANQWEAEQASGYHSGRNISAKRIENNTYGLRCFWKCLKKIEEIKDVKLEDITIDSFTPENLKIALSNVPVDYKEKKDSHSTKETIYFSFTSFMSFLVRQGLKTHQELTEARKAKPKRRLFPARKTILLESQLTHLLEVNEKWSSGRTAFDRALTRTLVILFSYAGLRRAEAMNLELSQVDLSNRVLYVVDGKGHKNRQVGICPELAEQLACWLSIYRPGTQPTSTRLLVNEHGRAVSKEVINHRIQSLSIKAAETDPTLSITPHGLRRTFATLMEARGMPWSLIQISLGHSDIKTTQGYIMSTQRQAVDWLKGLGGAEKSHTEAAEDKLNAILEALKG